VGADGEILLRGPTIARGYHRDPEATRAAFADGWLRTGDRGVLDTHGFLSITGRLKEVMVTAAGETIYPEEIEPYYASPCFAERCVAGRPGPDGNDLPTLFVVPASAGPSEADLAAVFHQLRASAPARLRLDRMICLDQPLPRTALGKLRRRAVVDAWLRTSPSPQNA
jgi:long-subunit acyl-CoA synthetase (AMP-forming)